MTDHEEIWAAFVAGVDVDAALSERPGGPLDRAARAQHAERVVEYRMRHYLPAGPFTPQHVTPGEINAWLRRRTETEELFAAYAARRGEIA